MSILKASSIYDKDGGSNAVLYGVAAPAGGMNFRNRIINGDMRIDQRNAGAAVTTNGSFPVDRFAALNDTDGAFSAQQDTVAPTGFVNSLKFTTTTADSSLAATQYAAIQHRIEGLNVADLAWGTANAQPVTLSFWVRSSLTGTFGGNVSNNAANRSYPFTYTISASNTWEQKSVTIPGDTSGTWLTTNGIGVRVTFGLGAGSTYSGTAGAWAGATYVSATGAVSVIGTLNATWYITGVQLEVGSVATPFERRPYGTELALCQRYYWKFSPLTGGRFSNGYAENTTTALGILSFPVAMRIAPTALEQSGTASDYVVRSSGANNVCSSVPTYQTASFYNAGVVFTVSSGLTSNGCFQMRANADAGYLAWSAEL